MTGDNKMNTENYDFLKTEIKLNGVAPFLLSKIAKKGKKVSHALLVYKIIEDQNNDIAYLLVYDSNYPYGKEKYFSQFHEAFSYIKYDLNSCKLSYEDYTKFLPLVEKISYLNSYGYNFANKGVKKDTMSESAKWKIFKEAFDWKDIDSVTQEKLFDTWVNNGKNWWEGNCFGMSVSSLMEYMYPEYDNFLEHKKEKTLYDFDEPSVSGIGGSLIPTNPWNGINAIDTVLEHILKFQIMTNSQTVQEKLSISDDKIEEYNPINVVMKLKSCPEKYVLGIVNSKTEKNHAVVPYKVEEQDDGYKIYIYDPNSPDYDDEWPNKTWIEAREGKWELFKEIVPWINYESKSEGDLLIPWSIEKIYNSKTLLKPAVPLAEGDYPVYHFCGSADFSLVDSQGRITGVKNGELIDEIPQVHRKYNFIDSNGAESEYQPQTYYVSDDTKLIATIEGTDDGTYSLTKFGPGYFADIFDVSISNGVTDSIDFSSDSAKLSFFENQEPKTYNFTLNKNINGASQTFTAIDIPTTAGQNHQYTVDWDVLSQGGEGTTLKIDLDGDGDFEETIITGDTFQPSEALEADDEPKQSTYTAPSGGGGLPQSLSISGSSIGTSAIRENTTTISWRTSQFSTSRVIYSSEDEIHNFDLDSSLNYGYAHSTEKCSTKATGHHITLYDLYPGTTYYYRCISASSPDVISREYKFTTLGEKPPLAQEASESEKEKEKEKEVSSSPSSAGEIALLEEKTDIETEQEASIKEEEIFTDVEEIVEKREIEEKPEGTEKIAIEPSPIPLRKIPQGNLLASLSAAFGEISHSTFFTVLLIMCLMGLIFVGIREWRLFQKKRKK